MVMGLVTKVLIKKITRKSAVLFGLNRKIRLFVRILVSLRSSLRHSLGRFHKF
jgi:hypothetical protein